MARTISFEGRTVEVPDDASDDEVAEILGGPAAPAKPSTLADVTQSAATGVEKGAIGLPGVPGDLQAMSNSMIDRIMLGAGHKVMDWTGLGPQAGTPERERFDRMYLGIGSGGGLPGSSDFQGAAERVVGPFYKPQTAAGRVAEAVGANAPAAALGAGGLLRKIMESVVPGVAGEGAAAAVPERYQDAARVGASLAGNLGVAAGSARLNAGDRAVVSATRGYGPNEIRAGQPVLDQGRGIGIDLSGPEGIQFATNNGTGLGNLQRVVEGSTGGAPIFTRFYADRPAQTRAAAENAFDTIAPQSPTPSMLGPRAAEAAGTAIDTVRQGINRATRPDYATAQAHVMDPADFAPIADNPAFQASLQRLRADPVLGPEIAQLPDGSGRVIDLVTRDMGARSDALGARGEGYNPLLAERYAAGAAETRDILRDPARGGVQAYDDALTAQAQARAQNLDPLTQGPLGAVARVGEGGAGTLNGTQAAGRAILPPEPLAGGQGELADATRRMGAVDPDTTAQLVRQRLADQYEQSATGLVGGPAQGGGAKFAKDIASDRASQKQANLDAVLGALPNSPAAPAAVNTLLDTLRATGTRRPAGSNTAADTETRGNLSEPGAAAKMLMAGKSAGLALAQDVKDSAQRAALGRANEGLARLFTAPDSAAQIAAIMQRGVEPVYANALLRQAGQLPGVLNGR